MPGEEEPVEDHFPIGTIVSLQGHPFFRDTDKDNTFISGDALSLSPLMIVTETFPEVTSNYSGGEKKPTLKCKCTWYSEKTGQFASTELSSFFLKKIIERPKTTDQETFASGSRVIFKTNFIELGKKKLSLKMSDNSGEEKNKTITALLAFTSPVLQVIGAIKPENKSLATGKKSRGPKKNISDLLLKCKFYSAVSEKFSEVILPAEALEAIIEVSSARIDQVNKLIADKCFLKVISPGLVFKYTLMRPSRIIYKSGNYFIEGNDYLENRMIEILLEEDSDQFTVIGEIPEQLPDYGVQDAKVSLAFVNKENLQALPQQNFWRIKYKSLNDTVTTRTIYQPTFCDYSETDEKKPKVIDYLQAKCILRDHKDRLFRIDRILRVEVLDLEFAENIKSTI